MTFGVAEVSVPTAHRVIGTLDTPNFLERKPGFQSDNLWLLKELTPYGSRDEWIAQVRNRVRQSGGAEALIYVHGFNVKFWEAILRAAQLGVDLEISGAVTAYSWPSRGNLFMYTLDRKELIQSHVEGLKALISDIAGASEVQKVIVIAHSMGCDFLLQALELLAVSGGTKPMLKDVIFAAPDVDASRFAHAIPKIRPIASRIAVYCSERDSALTWARRLYKGDNRAGQRADLLVDSIAHGDVEAIETSDVAADILGHSDYASSALDDVRAVVWLSLMPDRRATLVRATTAGGATYWTYKHPPEEKDAFRQAVLRARRYRGIEGALGEIRKSLIALRDNPDEMANFTWYSEIERELIRIT